MKKTRKRAVSDVKFSLDEVLNGELEKTVQKIEWNYETNTEQFHMRDKAVASFLILTGLRINEALEQKKGEVNECEDYLELRSIPTEKHGKPRKQILLAKTGRLAPFTRIFKEWFDQIEKPEDYLFPSATTHGEFIWTRHLDFKRSHQIFKDTIDRFPHWFRAINETIMGRLTFDNNPYALRDYMGLKSLESVTPYVQSQWEKDLKKVCKL